MPKNIPCLNCGWSPPDPRARKLKPLDMDKVIKLYKSGMSPASIAKQVNRYSGSGIVYRLRKAGVYRNAGKNS
jgi:hypothetical protein